MSLILGEHLINLAKAMTEKEISESLQRTEPEQKLKRERIPEKLREFPGDIMAWHGGGQSAKIECL
jgi:hypothetical protein